MDSCEKYADAITEFLVVPFGIALKEKGYPLFSSNNRSEPQGQFYLADQPFIEFCWCNEAVRRWIELVIYIKSTRDNLMFVPFFRIKNEENETLRFEDYYKNKYGKDLPVKYFTIQTIEQVGRLQEFLSLVLSELENGLSKIVDGEQWYATKFDWGPYK